MKLLNMLVGNVPEGEVNDLAFWLWIAVVYIATLMILTTLVLIGKAVL